MVEGLGILKEGLQSEFAVSVGVIEYTLQSNTLQNNLSDHVSNALNALTFFFTFDARYVYERDVPERFDFSLTVLSSPGMAKHFLADVTPNCPQGTQVHSSGKQFHVAHATCVHDSSWGSRLTPKHSINATLS